MKKILLTGAVSIFLLISLTACGTGNAAKAGGAASKTMETQETEMMEETSKMENTSMMEETTMAGKSNGMDNNAMMESSDMTGKEESMDNNTAMEGSGMMESTAMMDETGMMNQGNPAPDFEMMDLNGNSVKLSDFNGEKVYLKYWASWCPICLGGLEDINTLSAEENGFRVLTIVAPGQKGEKNTEDFKKWFSGVENTENITVLFDTDGNYGTQTGVRGYPTSEYIGSDGVMVKLVPGHADNDTIKTTFESIK